MIGLGMKRDVAKGTSNIDGLVKSLFYPFVVIPAKVRIQLNQKRYSGQRIMVIGVNNYAYLVPYVEDEEEIFLKTLIPSRKATEIYFGRKRK